MSMVSKISPTFGRLFISEASPVSDVEELHPFTKIVLILGDGNFSFALAYAKKHPNYRIIATEYCKYKVLIRKYPKAKANIRELKRMPNVTVYANLDATKLGKYRLIENVFDKVIFNFPHTGRRDGSTAEMIDKFFKTVKNVLAQNGKVQMGLVDSSHFDSRYFLWKASTRYKFKMIKRKSFDPRGYYRAHGYQHVSTLRNRMITDNKCLKYTFRYDSTADSEDEFLHSSGLSSDEGRLDHLSCVRRRLGKGKGRMTNSRRNRLIIVKKYGSYKKAREEVSKLMQAEEFKKAEKLMRRLIKVNPRDVFFKVSYELLRVSLSIEKSKLYMQRGYQLG